MSLIVDEAHFVYDTGGFPFSLLIRGELWGIFFSFRLAGLGRERKSGRGSYVERAGLHHSPPPGPSGFSVEWARGEGERRRRRRDRQR